MLDFISEHQAALSIVLMGITATVLFFYQLKQKSVPKAPTQLRGINNTCVVILKEKKMINHDTMLLNIQLSGQDLVLGLSVGQCIKIYGKDKDGQQIIRPYTPISKVHKKGSFDLLIKVYFPCEKFPEGGQMTQYLHSLPEQSKIRITGPSGNLKFLGNKKFLISKRKGYYQKISLVGGGSGITPLYQMIIHLLEEGSKKYKITLLYANKTEQDILLRKELDQLKESGQIDLYYTLDNPDKNWKGYKGFVNKEMMNNFPKPSNDHLILACGPVPMMNDVERITEEMGHQYQNVYFY